MGVRKLHHGVGACEKNRQDQRWTDRSREVRNDDAPGANEQPGYGRANQKDRSARVDDPGEIYC